MFDERAKNYNDISVISKDLRTSISDLFPVHGEGFETSCFVIVVEG